MNYLLLICGDESAAEHADEGCGGWTEEMRARGVLRGGAGLRPPDEATTVRVREERCSCPTARSPRPRSRSAGSP